MSTMQPSFSAGAMTHGAMMFLVFGVFMPISVMSARYLRRFPKTGPIRFWWGVHAFFNALSASLFLVAWTIAVYISTAYQFTNTHKKLGLAILVIIIVQLFWGAALSALHAFKPGMRRNTPFEWVHWVLGYSLLILGWVNIPYGLYQAAPIFAASRLVDILYFVWFGCLIAFMIGLEVIYRIRGGNELWKRPINEATAEAEATRQGEKQRLGSISTIGTSKTVETGVSQ